MFSVVLAIGAGIGWYVAWNYMKPAIVQTSLTVSPAPLSQTQSVSDMKESSQSSEPAVASNNLIMGAIVMTLPSDWTIREHSDTRAVIRTETKPYEVDLVVTKRDFSPEEFALYKDQSNGAGFGYVDVPEVGQIFVLGCGGPVSCDGVLLDTVGYGINWEIQSNQPAPENLDGIWAPDHKVADVDIQSVMKTIRAFKD